MKGDSLVDSQGNVPVVLCVYNRPAETRAVLLKVREASPKKIFVVADGPKDTVPSDGENCAEVRSVIQREIDWDCELHKDYASENMGCKKRMSTGLNRVFGQVDQAIILEDDCVPSASFFPYCELLLRRFADDPRVMQICGTNVNQESANQKYSYYFSKFGPVWGWASWRRAWKFYDVEMRAWPSVVREKLYKNFWEYPGEAEFRLDTYAKVYRGETDTWDLQWGLAKFLNSGLSIIPSKNLISNVGYGSTATHTRNEDIPVAHLKADELEFPLVHYPFVIRDKQTELDFHNIITPPEYRTAGATSTL